MKTAIKYILAGVTLMLAYKTSVVYALDHFEPEEFRGEWPWLATGLLVRLDDFREELGRSVWPSPTQGSMIRFGNGTSQHYFGRAIDVILEQDTDLMLAFEAAKSVGFSGIGIYPNSGGVNGRHRMHLDIRPEREAGDPAVWGEVDGREVSIYTAIREGRHYG